MKTPRQFESCAERLKALADPDRLRIVQCLFKGERSVGDLASHLNEDIAKVSHHLGVLWHANIVSKEKRGRFVVYSLHPEVSLEPGADESLNVVELGCCRLDLARRKK